MISRWTLDSGWSRELERHTRLVSVAISAGRGC
jgi:hypothetical protein